MNLMTSFHRLRDRLPSYLGSHELGQLGRLLYLSLLVGVPTGLVATLFNWLITESAGFFLGELGNYFAPLPGGEGGDAAEGMGAGPIRPWVLFFLPALGGLISGWIVWKFAPEAEGHGTDQVIEAFHHRRGHIRARVPFIKMISSAITIGSGGAAGREGPVAQVGAGLAANVAGLLRMTDRERRILLLAGAGAGIGAIFRAPLGGALFAVEVLYRESEFEFEALIPSFISSIVAYSIYCPLSGHGWGHIFSSGPFTFNNVIQLAFYLALALVVFIAGRVYLEVFYTVRNRLFKRMNVPGWLKPAIGGLMLGVLALIFGLLMGMESMGAVYGAGYGYLQQALDGRVTLSFLILLALFKILATSCTIGSGGSGGVFGPSIVIGGLVGGALGLIANRLFPDIITPSTVSAFSLVGMAGFWAGVANVPVASLIMISEMTAGYTLLVPLMLVTAISYTLSMRHRSIYEQQLPARIDSPAHTGDFVTDVLMGIRVRDVLRTEAVETVHEEMLLGPIMERVTESRQTCFPVLDDESKLVGLISLNDIRSVFTEPGLADLLIARDIADDVRERIFADETLNIALRRFITSNSEELPVVEADAPHRVVGMLNRRDLIVAYNKELQRQMSPA